MEEKTLQSMLALIGIRIADLAEKVCKGTRLCAFTRFYALYGCRKLYQESRFHQPRSKGDRKTFDLKNVAVLSFFIFAGVCLFTKHRSLTSVFSALCILTAIIPRYVTTAEWEKCKARLRGEPLGDLDYPHWKYCHKCGEPMLYMGRVTILKRYNRNIRDWPICKECMREHCKTTDCTQCKYSKRNDMSSGICRFIIYKDGKL